MRSLSLLVCVFLVSSIARGGENSFPADGNVLIGTQTPITKLTVNGGVSATSFHCLNGAVLRANPGVMMRANYTGLAHNDTIVGSYMQSNGYSHGYISTGYLQDPNRKLSLGTADSPDFSTANFVPYLTMTTGGFIGIGNSSPAYKLHVLGSVGVDGPLFANQGVTAPSVSSSVLNVGTASITTIVNDNLSTNNLNALNNVNAGQVTGNTVSGGTVNAGALNVSGGVRMKRTAVAADYTATTSDYLIAVTNLSVKRTITLPSAAAAGTGATIIIKDETGQAGFSLSVDKRIIVKPIAGETIDSFTAANPPELKTAFGSLTLYSNGAKWFFLNLNP